MDTKAIKTATLTFVFAITMIFVLALPVQAKTLYYQEVGGKAAATTATPLKVRKVFPRKKAAVKKRAAELKKAPALSLPASTLSKKERSAFKKAVKRLKKSQAGIVSTGLYYPSQEAAETAALRFMSCLPRRTILNYICVFPCGDKYELLVRATNEDAARLLAAKKADLMIKKIYQRQVKPYRRGLKQAQLAALVEKVVVAQLRYTPSDNGGDLTSSLRSGTGNCADMAFLYDGLAKRAGLRTKLVFGRTETGAFHAWNAVCIGGKWRQVDLTPAGKSEAKPETSRVIVDSRGKTLEAVVAF